MASVLGPKQSAELITSHSKHVTISTKGVDKLAVKLLGLMKENPELINSKRWNTHPLNPSSGDESAIDWLFLIDALNFSFWSVDSNAKYSVTYKGKTHTGYWSLCAAVNRAIDDGTPILSAEYCKDISMEEAKRIFRSDNQTEMPMLDSRVKVMNEIGQILWDKFDGRFINCLSQAQGDAQKLLRLVVDNFPCFRDENEYEGKIVSFYKRAQILVADIWACFEGKGPGNLTGIDTITMFADYRIPQTLVYFNVMSYSNELNALLDNNQMFNNGDSEEMEIRAVSIWAVELLVARINELMKNNSTELLPVNAILLDHFLWDYRRDHDAQTRDIPFHKVRCIYY